MAKNKKSKILASMLAVSTMAVFYAAPVMAADVSIWQDTTGNKIDFIVENDKGTAVPVVTFDNGGLTVYNGSGTWPVFEIDRHQGALRAADGHFTVDAYGNVISKGNITSTDGIRSYDLNTIGANTAGIRREIDDGGHKTIIEEQLVVNRDSQVISNIGGSFTVDGSGNLVASTLGNRSGTFGVDGEGAVKAANGAFYVDKDGNVKSKLINGVDVKAVEGTVDGLTIDVDNLTADTSRLSANVDDLSADTKRLTGNVEDLKTDTKNIRTDVSNLSADTQRLSGNVEDLKADTQNIRADIGNLKTDIGNNNADISGLKDKTQGIDHYANKTTYFNGAVNVEGNVISKYGGFVIGEDSATSLYEGELKLGAEAGQTLKATQLATINSVITEKGEVVSQGDVTSTDGTNTYRLNSIGTNTAGIRRTQSGDTNVTVIEENLKVYGDGTIVGANENFKVTADGTVISDKLNVGNGNFTVSDEGIGAFGSKFTVNTNGEISTTGINVAEGMFTASAGGVTMANNNLSVDLNGNIKAGTYNGVKIGMNEDGDIILGDGTVIDDNFNSDNVAGITRKPLDDSAPGSGNTTYIEQNTAISADGIVVRDPESGVSTKTKYDGFYVKDEYGNNVSSLTQDKLNLAGENLAYKDSEGNINVTADTYTAGDVAGENVRVKADGIYVKDGGTIVSSLEDDGLMLTDQESGESHTLNATDIADIKGIDHSGNDIDGYTTTIEGATSFTKDGMVTSNITTNSFTAGVTEDSIYHINAKGEMLFRSGDNYIGMNRDGIGLMSGTESVTINGDGTTFTSGSGDSATSTFIKGGTITTDTLNVENIVLGNSMTDEDGNSIALSADGTLKVNNEKYSLNLDENGFNLSNANNTSFSLGDDGFKFAGPVNLGAGDKVGFTHTSSGEYITLDGLVNRVENLEQKTQGISFDETTGSTTIADKVGTDGVESNNSMTVGNNGTTFENGTDSKTNINGGAIDADSSSIGNDVSGGSGSGSSGMTGDGTYTDGSEHSGHFVDKDSSYEFTNDANGFTGNVTDGKNTTTIENGAMGSNTTVKDDNASASSGVGIGNDGAFISDSVTNGDISHTVNGGSITDTVTNGDMTVTEVKDKNGSATTVKDAKGSSTVSQDRNGQTVSTGTGTSVNTGNDFSVTDNETGKSIYMSDIGHVEDIDSEIQNSDGSKTTVVDAVNNEAEIRRNEIERVDGRINNLENRVGELEDRIDKVGAMAAAIANLRTMGYDPAAPTEVAVGIGQYRDETGAALGLFHYPNRDFMLSLSVSTSGDEVMGGIGATWKFGRKSPEKVAEIKKAQAEADARRAEEAKLAKAEEMKQAAKEAKIKAQQERHAKLAAERAAQAEAAK